MSDSVRDQLAAIIANAIGHGEPHVAIELVVADAVLGSELLTPPAPDVAAIVWAMIARATKEPLGIDLSDFSDEFVAGFLRGQENALYELDAAIVDAFGVAGIPPQGKGDIE